MSRWWRAYDEALDDPKLQKLSAELFRCWFNLMCLTSKNGGHLPAVSDIAFALRIAEPRVAKMVEELQRCQLIDETDDGKLHPHNWNGRQYKSDVSTERVKQHRERQRNVSCNVSETETETDDERSEKRNGSVSGLLPTSATSLEVKEVRAEPVDGRKQPKTPLPSGFTPERRVPDELGWDEAKFLSESMRFCEDALAHDRRYSRWQMAWAKWCRSPYQTQQNQLVNGHGSKRSGSIIDAAEEAERRFASGDDSTANPNAFLRLSAR